MGQLQNQDINLRNCRRYFVCLEYGAAGAYLGAYGADLKVTRVGSGNYTIRLPQLFKRCLGGGIQNAAGTPFLDDTALGTTGIVTVTFTEPGAPRRIFIEMIVPTDDYNARV